MSPDLRELRGVRASSAHWFRGSPPAPVPLRLATMRTCVWAGPRFLSVRACARGSSQALCMGTGPRARMAAGLGAQPCCYCHLVFTSCAARAPGGDRPGGGRWGRFLKCRGHLRSVPQRTRRGCCGGFGSRCLMQAAHPHASEPEPKRARERACVRVRVCGVRPRAFLPPLALSLHCHLPPVCTSSHSGPHTRTTGSPGRLVLLSLTLWGSAGVGCQAPEAPLGGPVR